MFGRLTRASVPVVPDAAAARAERPASCGARSRRWSSAPRSTAASSATSDALQLKSRAVPRGARRRARCASLDARATFKALCALMPTVRRRIGPWLDGDRVRARCARTLAALLDGRERHRRRRTQRIGALLRAPSRRTARTAGCATSPPRCCTTSIRSAIPLMTPLGVGRAAPTPACCARSGTREDVDHVDHRRPATATPPSSCCARSSRSSCPRTACSATCVHLRRPALRPGLRRLHLRAGRQLPARRFLRARGSDAAHAPPARARRRQRATGRTRLEAHRRRGLRASTTCKLLD